MKNDLMTDFTVDTENNTIKVRREFMAPLKHVWAAWTEKELCDLEKVLEMGFREGVTAILENLAEILSSISNQ